MPSSVSVYGRASVGQRPHRGRVCMVIWPLAGVRATEKGIAVRVLWKRYYFGSETISEIKLYHGILEDWGQIIHTKQSCPPFVLFASIFPSELSVKLKRLGYPLQETWSEGRSGRRER